MSLRRWNPQPRLSSRTHDFAGYVPQAPIRRKEPIAVLLPLVKAAEGMKEVTKISYGQPLKVSQGRSWMEMEIRGEDGLQLRARAQNGFEQTIFLKVTDLPGVMKTLQNIWDSKNPTPRHLRES